MIALAGVIAALASSPRLAAAPADTFDGSRLDWCRWEDTSVQGASVAQADRLRLTTNGSQPFSSAQVLTQARFTGDFDVQVAYQRGAGFDTPPATGLLVFGMALYWDQARLVQFQRLRAAGGDTLAVYSSLPQHAGATMPSLPWTSASGRLRLVRAGTVLRLLHSEASGWRELGTVSVPDTPLHLQLYALNTSEPRTFVVDFDDYQVTSGSSDQDVEAQGAFFHRRDDFAVAAFTENYPVEKHWRHGFAAKDLFATLREAGFDWAKTSVTTLSMPQLEVAAPEQWGTLAWNNDFWSSREFAAETLRAASAHGMRLEVQLLLSHHAAYWGYQEAPPAWVGKSVDETAALVEQSAYETAMYFAQRGLRVERYAVGNEIDIGILDFLPRGRIAVPAGVDSIGDLTWLRENVWKIEARLLKAAVAGVKRANADAQIILHIAGLEITPGNVFATAFFQAMRDFGVAYDHAALSHPYASYPWKLDRYSTACWFERLGRTIDRIHAATGKPVMMVEASYPARADAANVASPMTDFPFSPEGQAAWVREQLRFASTRPNVASWHYFYPDMPRDLMDPASAEQVSVSASSLFESAATARPALAEFRVNLAAPSVRAVEFYHAALDHYFISALPGDITALDSGRLAGWARTGQSFRVFPDARAGTSPVCRFYLPPAVGDSHFYSASVAECADVARRFPSFVEESREVMDVLLPTFADGACPAGSQPVYRVWNNRADTNHRYVVDRSLRTAMVGRGYVPEGYGPDAVALCVPR